jgi:SAM-dependent methyltransferase
MSDDKGSGQPPALASGRSVSYDAYYSKPVLYWSFNVAGKVRSFRRLARRCGLPLAGVRVLDVGFGAGSMLLQFDTHCTLFGVETSASAVERLGLEARRRGRTVPNLLLWRALDQGLPFLSGSFDVVIMSHVLEHVPDDAHLVEEARRLLTELGYLMVMVPLDDPLWRDNPDHVRVYDLPALIALLQLNGFTVQGYLVDHSVENVFRSLREASWLRHAAAARRRLLGALSLACALLPGMERASLFGPPRNLAVIARPATVAPLRSSANSGPALARGMG